MRILFISSFYPPYVVGGWEQLVRDINECIQARGHTTHVLTSTHGIDSPKQDEHVSRLLHPDSDLFRYNPIRELKHGRMVAENLAHTKAVIESFQPDIIFVHVMFNLSKGIPWQAEQMMPNRVAYWIANDWPFAADPHTSFWNSPLGNPIKRKVKAIIGKIPLAFIERENKRFQLNFKHVMCVSQAIVESLNQEAGISRQSLSVLHNGVETDLFKPSDQTTRPADQLDLLYAGSIVDHKGVHTIVEALQFLREQNKLDKIKLTIVGGGHPDYEAYLEEYVQDHHLNDVVEFYGRVPRSEMAQLLERFNVLVFPSIWEEPLSRMMQEAMSAGLTVVGTLTGGSGELLVEGDTGLTFDKENHLQLAERLLELQNNPELRQRLAKNGRDEVVKRFSMARMIDEIEESLERIVASDNKK